MMDRRDFLRYLGVAGASAALLKVNPASAARPKPGLPGQASSNQINILVDSWSTQVMVHQLPSTVYFPPTFTPGPNYNTGVRLNTLLGAMKSFGFASPPTSSNRAWNISYTYTNPPITAPQLTGQDVYVSFTRMQGTDFAYKTEELNLLQDFVNNQGKSILLMTNHGPLPSAPTDNYTQNDSALAAMFYITLLARYVTLNSYMVMDVNNQDPTLQYIANQVTAIVAHDSCIIQPQPNIPFTSIAKFPIGAQSYDGSTNQWKNPPETPYFSILVPSGLGKVIIVGNSGMIGDYGSPYPADGIIPLENNLMFFLNCVGFLAGFNCIPALGKGPCSNSVSNIGAIDMLLLND
jgi:hypothetical protein